ncbi:ATP-dependent DNA helicase RecG, partial [Anaerotruncus colihominis]|nr:ATP-dependent DNA helicase RecG [Anaerotruncus colihominis]
QKAFANLVEQALARAPGLPERIPETVRAGNGLEGIGQAVRDIHRPSDAAALERAKRRLIFEELFMLAAGVGLLRTRARTEQAAPYKTPSANAAASARP